VNKEGRNYGNLASDRNGTFKQLIDFGLFDKSEPSGIASAISPQHLYSLG